MDLRIVVTPKLLQEAVVHLLSTKFSIQITDAQIIISDSCNLTDTGGVTIAITTAEEKTRIQQHYTEQEEITST